MKRKQVGWTVALVITVCTAQTGWSFYNPSTGKWLSRDPVNEIGGLNIYSPYQNDLIGKIDLIGLCGCTLKSIEIKTTGWLVDDPNFPQVKFVFIATVTFVDSCGDRCRCCLVEQLISAKMSVDGQPIPTSSNGTPLDGHYHLDPVPDLDSDPCIFKIADAPGISAGINKGQKVEITAKLRIRVRDNCDPQHIKNLGNEEISFSANGKYPDGLKFNPAPKK